ncbi:penicillin-binding protein 2 [soil metagenome]
MRKKFDHNWRYWLVIIFLFVAVTALVGRVVYLMIISRGFLQGQGDARSLRTVSIPAYRGMITDRNGQPLAVSTPVDSVWIDPSAFNPSSQELEDLGRLLSLDAAAIKAKAEQNGNKEFLYIKRDLNPFLAQQVKRLDIEGVFLQREFKCYYPEGEVTAQLVGFTNIDDSGQEGLELAYNQWLQGAPGEKRVIRDRLGQVVKDLELVRSPRKGNNLTLSIDRRVQYLAYRELKDALVKFKAESGTVVVLDVNSGEVLGMVNLPSFNPNNRHGLVDMRMRNRAVTDVFEPGSTIKAFSVANALMSGKFTPKSKVDTRPGHIWVYGKQVKDHESCGLVDVTGVLQHSSNVGVTKLTFATVPSSLWSWLSKVGFGHSTESTFPGESSGVLNRTTRQSFVLATLSFGYGMSATNLQLAHAYSVLASGGIKRPISLIHKEGEMPQGERVIKEEYAKQIVTMLRSVVENKNSAGLAKIPGYLASGKTGTVRMLGPHGYEKHRHVSLFAGMAPATKPRLVTVVVINDPQGAKYYGAQVAAPVFSSVMGGALRLLDVPMDDVASEMNAEKKG